MVVDRTRLAPACSRGVFAFPLAGKCKSIRVRFVLLAATRFKRELSIESCLVAWSKSRGDRAPVLAHQGSSTGVDRVIGPMWLGEFLAK